MPFINSKISVALTDAQEQEIKARLGQAITAIPGKSESWLMVGFGTAAISNYKRTNKGTFC